MAKNTKGGFPNISKGNKKPLKFITRFNFLEIRKWKYWIFERVQKTSAENNRKNKGAENNRKNKGTENKEKNNY